MIHLGDITKIKGNEAPVVDCIVGGSPCQDLSLAGKRAGLAGARSGLYMEQIRIIKEMREYDRFNGRTGVDVRPRYMVWENVPGAFSTNGGRDFAAVLEEAIRVAEPEAPDVPVPEKGWPTAGCIVGEQWSVAWRVLDAQFWGTPSKPLPQRRRRIALVADFGGLSASEILFVRKSVSGDIEPGKQKGKETAGDVGESSTGAIPCTLKIRSGVDVDSKGKAAGKGALIQTDKTGTLSTVQDQYLFQPVAYGFDPQACRDVGQYVVENMANTLTNGTNPGWHNGVCYGIGAYHSNAWKSDNPNSGVYEADTSKTLDSLNCGYPACNQGGMAVVQPVGCDIYGLSLTGDKAVTLTTQSNATGSGPRVIQPVVDQHILDDQGGSQISVRNDGKSPTLRAETHGHPPCVMETVCIEGNGSRPSHKGDGYCESGTMYTLNATEHHGVAYTYDARGNGDGDIACTITGGHQSSISDYTAVVLEPVAYNGSNITSPINKTNPQPGDPCHTHTDDSRNYVVESQLASGKDVTGCLMASGYDKLGAQEMFSGDYTVIETQVESVPYAAQSYHEIKESDVGASLKASGGVLGGGSENFVVTGVDCRNATEYAEQTATLQSNACHNLNSNNVVRVKHIVRRLTPLECERLQGFPDGWTDIGEWVDSKGKKHKEADSPRYKALGNSIAIPPWKWLMKRLCACYERDATLASLFDGIGGFPYIWEQINGKGSCLWASEIEEFPIAVTKVRFGE